MFGMRMNERVIASIQETKLRDGDTVLGDFAEIITEVLSAGLVPKTTAHAFSTWCDDVEVIQYG